ncbi:MAG: replicative DNA helicase [Clostridia bacterium]|nr:replicative DNA helicase [Clostridia bacterium]
MSGEEFSRKLPYSLEAEQSVLGSILINPECISDLSGIMTSEDFYLAEHREIYSSMQEMFLKNREIDIVTLIDTLVSRGVYDKSESQNYVRVIAEIVPSAANVRDYAKIVADKAALRRLIEACGDISDTAFSEQGDVEHIIDSAEQKIFSIAQGRENRNFVHIKDALQIEYSFLHTLINDKEAAIGMPTGFTGLDRVLVGMGKGDLVLVGARPGMGKTSFAMNIAANVAKHTHRAVCVFSLEMSVQQLISRMLSSEAMVDSYAIRTGNLNDDDWEKLAHASAELSECDIYIDDTTGQTITAMKAKLRRIQNLGLVVIDYLQLMQSDRRIDNRVQEVAEISRNLKIMAKELGVPVVTCAQLSRGPESRTDKRPMLSDLRDSGAIEQDADMVLFLYRDEYYAKEGAANTAEVIIAKNRHGSTGKVEMGWLSQYTKFITVDEKHD